MQKSQKTTLVFTRGKLFRVKYVQKISENMSTMQFVAWDDR